MYPVPSCRRLLPPVSAVEIRPLGASEYFSIERPETSSHKALLFERIAEKHSGLGYAAPRNGSYMRSDGDGRRESIGCQVHQPRRPRAAG